MWAAKRRESSVWAIVGFGAEAGAVEALEDCVVAESRDCKVRGAEFWKAGAIAACAALLVASVNKDEVPEVG